MRWLIRSLISWERGFSSDPAFITPRQGPLCLNDAGQKGCFHLTLPSGGPALFPLRQRILIVSISSPSSASQGPLISSKGRWIGTEVEEGMTWKELYQTLTDRRSLNLNLNLSLNVDPVTWSKLLVLLFEERSFFGLKKDSGGKDDHFQREKFEKRFWTIFLKRPGKFPF